MSLSIPASTPSSIILALSVAYPAILTRSLKFKTYSSIRFSFIFRLLSCALDFSSLVESWNCASKVSRNCVYTTGMLSTAGSRASIVSPIVLTQLATLGPFIYVRVK